MAISLNRDGVGMTATDRNKRNENWEKIEREFEKVGNAVPEAEAAKLLAEEAKAQAIASEEKSENVQEQINQLVVDGDSSVEAAQARVSVDGTSYSTLKERLDAEQSETAVKLADKVGGQRKLQPEEFSDDAMALVTGNGTVNVLSIPQKESVSPEKLDANIQSIFDFKIKNLFTGDIVQGNVESSTGNLIHPLDTTRSVTLPIPIDPTKKVYTNRLDIINPPTTSDQPFTFYDENKVFISTIRGYGEVQPPSNARYVRQNLSASSYSVDPNLYSLWQEYVSGEMIRSKQMHEQINELQSGQENSPTQPHTLFVYDFSDPSLTDSENIKNCLDFASVLPYRTIVFDRKDWNISEAILFKSNTTLIVDGCTIKQNDEVFDNVFRGDNLTIDPDNPNGFPISIDEIENFKILAINGAKIEGPDVNAIMTHPSLGEQEAVGDYWGWRTFQICLSKASNFEIAGFELTKTRCWAMSFDKCHHYKVHDLHIVSTVKNGDGVDNRAGCHDFEVYNITGSTSDDTVAMTAGGYTEAALTYPRGNYVYPLEPSRFENLGLTKEELAIRDGSVYNINTIGNHHGVICLGTDGLQVHDISINKIHEPSASTRESVVKLYSAYGTGYVDGDIHNIRVNDVISKGADYAVQSTAVVNNVWFNKIRQEKADGSVSSFTNSTGITITNS